MEHELVDAHGQLLNHVELVYRSGERKLVAKVFETLGCSVVETGGPYLVIQVSATSGNFLNNVLYASEVTAAQAQLESALEDQLVGGGAVASAFRAYEEQGRREPQRTTHFGIRMPSVDDLEKTLARIESLDCAELDGRLEVAGVFRPGDPGALSDALIQGFVHTNVFASGLVSLGQYIELQAQLG